MKKTHSLRRRNIKNFQHFFILFPTYFFFWIPPPLLMTILSTSTTDSSGTPVQLRVVDDIYLYIESSQNEIIEKYELKHIYGIDKEQDKTLIHYCHIIDPQQEQKEGENNDKTITNFRTAGIKLWEQRTLKFQGTLDDAFINGFRQLIVPNQNDDVRVSVIINPAAGGRQAPVHWETIVKPMLLAAGFNASQFQITQTLPNGKTRGLAKQLGIQMLKDKKKTIILCLGGDGTTHDVVNGLSDAFIGFEWQEEEQRYSVPTFQLGIIPSGSGNSFSLSLKFESIEHSVLQVIKGQTQPFRLIDVTLDPDPAVKEKGAKAPKRRILVVMSWGFHAQLVSKSRYLQPFMGNTRFSWVAMYLLLFLQQHEGELTMIDAERYDPTRKEFVHEGQVELKDKPFTYFLVANQDSMERGFKIAPFATPEEETMDIVMMRDVNKEELKAATIKVLEGGRHVDDEKNIVEYYKSPELLLRVKHASELCLDGEIVYLAAGGIVRLKMIGPSQGEPNFMSFV
ncbi:ATP-NAD kinase-like domain-containing protein [Phascolomyces articulosus]|uniref:ATP-NAD kinase-like domain-containing protein n=1 Tax=Phascolomyces articulosus TaxID=60185 RepID=A0AAD5K5U7_9FUNG|nr:ATP-NAD kinase-like domain-containing protein [Phascolomyces articulosus]